MCIGETEHCRHCGGAFTVTSRNQKYCTRACRVKAEQRRYDENREYKRLRCSGIDEISRISREAEKAGMSYGKYVAFTKK